MANNFPEIENLDFDWNDLKYVLTVARHGGLSQAAKILGSSASTVARHVQQLETALGHTLFLRQQSGYLLTDEGKEVLSLITNVEQALLALERRDANSANREVRGFVRLASAELMANYLITPNLPKLYQRHPHLQVDLAVSLKLADLNRREADLALRMTNPGEKHGEQDYIGISMGKLRFSAYRSKHMENEDHYINWGSDWEHLPMAQWMKQHFKSQEPRFTSNSANVQLQAARSGIGVAMLPCFIGDADRDLVKLNLHKNELSRDIWLVYHRDLKASSRVQAMKDFLIECANMHLSH